MRYRFHELAKAELDWAVGSCEPSRGRHVLRAFDDVLEWATSFPHSGSPILELDTPLEVRAFLLGRFEYTVVVAVLQDEIVIVAVAHQRQEPGYWRGRLRDV